MSEEFTVITRVKVNTNWLGGVGTYQYMEGDIGVWTYAGDTPPMQLDETEILNNLAYNGNEVDPEIHEVIALVQAAEDKVFHNICVGEGKKPTPKK